MDLKTLRSWRIIKNKIAKKLEAKFKNINLKQNWLGERLQRDMYEVADGLVPVGEFESKWFRRNYAPKLIGGGLENPNVKNRIAKGMSPLDAVMSAMADARNRAIGNYVNTQYYAQQLKELAANPGNASYMERYLPGLTDTVRSQIENFR